MNLLRYLSIRKKNNRRPGRQLNTFTKAAGGRAAPAPESSRQGGGAYGYIYRIISVRNHDLRRYNLSVICK